MENKYCINCGRFCTTEEVCPICGKKLTMDNTMPEWKLEHNMRKLKAMHELMCLANDENIYMAWATEGMPDCPSEQDFFEVALEEEECEEMFELFKELIQKKGYW